MPNKTLFVSSLIAAAMLAGCGSSQPAPKAKTPLAVSTAVTPAPATDTTPTPEVSSTTEPPFEGYVGAAPPGKVAFGPAPPGTNPKADADLQKFRDDLERARAATAGNTASMPTSNQH